MCQEAERLYCPNLIDKKTRAAVRLAYDWESCEAGDYLAVGVAGLHHSTELQLIADANNKYRKGGACAQAGRWTPAEMLGLARRIGYKKHNEMAALLPEWASVMGVAVKGVKARDDRDISRIELPGKSGMRKPSKEKVAGWVLESMADAASASQGGKVSTISLGLLTLFEWSCPEAKTHSMLNLKVLVADWFHNASAIGSELSGEAIDTRARPEWIKYVLAFLKRWLAPAAGHFNAGQACAVLLALLSNPLLRGVLEAVRVLCRGGLRQPGPLWAGAFKRHKTFVAKYRICALIQDRPMDAREMSCVTYIVNLSSKGPWGLDESKERNSRSKIRGEPISYDPFSRTFTAAAGHEDAVDTRGEIWSAWRTAPINRLMSLFEGSKLDVYIYIYIYVRVSFRCSFYHYFTMICYFGFICLSTDNTVLIIHHSSVLEFARRRQPALERLISMSVSFCIFLFQCCLFMFYFLITFHINHYFGFICLSTNNTVLVLFRFYILFDFKIMYYLGFISLFRQAAAGARSRGAAPRAPRRPSARLRMPVILCYITLYCILLCYIMFYSIMLHYSCHM